MSQVDEILSIQKNLEASFTRRMEELEAQIQSAGPAKDTVAKVAEEFRTFRELIFSMFKLLRQQISECAQQVDNLESRHRRKALIFQGLSEVDGEDCRAVILTIIHNKLSLKDLSAPDLKVCHRIGAPNKDHHRPILVWFSNTDARSVVWRAKSRLKGSSVSVKEFLTKSRQSLFTQARLHFGLRSCWTQDGVIVVKASDGNRHRITVADELNPLLLKYPKVQPQQPSRSGADGAGGNLRNTRKC